MGKFKIDDIIEYKGHIYQIVGFKGNSDSFIYNVKCLNIMPNDDEVVTGIGSCAEDLMKLVDFTNSISQEEKEKIKAYDIAVEKAKECLKDGTVTSTVIAVLHDMFPELSVSDDERIRKEIIEMLRNWASVHYITKEQFSERMAWLEKQKKGQNILEEGCQAPKVTTICGKDYICIKDYKEGNCEYSKGYVYHCERDGYLNDNYGNSWSCTPEWYDEHVREEKSYVAEKEKETFVSGHFLRYDGSDIYGLKSGENYWLEYVGNDTYIGRSDNILNQRFDITPKQLFTLFSVITDYKESTVEDANSKTESEDEANAPVLDAEAHKKDVLIQTAMSIIDWVGLNTLEENESLSGMECEGITNFVLDSDWGKLYDIIKDKLEHHASNESIKIEEHAPMTLINYLNKPIFSVGDVMRTKDEAKKGIVNGLPVVVSIDENYYHCTNELIPIKDQFEYEYPPMVEKPVANETAEDKDKPNVKEGDWLINSVGQPIKITRIYKDVYGTDRCALTFTDGTRTDPLLELVIADKNARHWDIRKDAKDGDILVWDDFGDRYIFIFKCITDDHADSYCGLNIYLGKIETGEDENSYYNLSEIKPADKEERTILETALRDAGIKWNADDKTIVAVEPKFNVGDTIIKLSNSDINDFGQFTITDITGGKYYYNDRIICDIVDQNEWAKINNTIAED